MNLEKSESWKTEPTSATFADGLDFVQWREIGRSLCDSFGRCPWWIGAWINYGLRTYCPRDPVSGKYVASDAYKFALVATGLEYQTLARFASVERAIANCRRRQTVSWTHHAEVAGCPDSEQEKWLQRVEDQGLSVAQLRAAMRAGDDRKALGDGKPTFTLSGWAADGMRWFAHQLDQDPIDEWPRDRREITKKLLAPIAELHAKL